MSQHGKQKQPSHYQQPKPDRGAVASGKPYPAGPQNMAVQRSLMEIFDEFTDVISGELKSMNLEEFEAETKGHGKKERKHPQDRG